MKIWICLECGMCGTISPETNIGQAHYDANDYYSDHCDGEPQILEVAN